MTLGRRPNTTIFGSVSVWTILLPRKIMLSASQQGQEYFTRSDIYTPLGYIRHI